MSLISLPQLSCPPTGSVPGGVKRLRIIRSNSLYNKVSCCGTQLVTGPIYLKPGTVIYDIPLDAESVRYQYPGQRSVHGVSYQHIISGTRRDISAPVDVSLAIISRATWIAIVDFNDGRSRIIGSQRFPLRYIGGGDYPEDNATPAFTSWRFEGVGLAPACFISDSDQVKPVDCSTVAPSEFNLGGFTFNESNLLIGIPTPTPASGSIVSQVLLFDDGTIEQTSGGAFADGLTETSLFYDLDGGPVALTPGIYHVRMPIVVQLIDGTVCPYVLEYDLTYTIGCADVSAADFLPIVFQFNPSGEWTGFAVPSVNPASAIVASINTYDDGTIEELPGGGYADGITETGGVYEPDGGPVTLSGTYRVRVPMSVTLTTGASCAFVLEEDIDVANIFDPSSFDPTIFA